MKNHLAERISAAFREKGPSREALHNKPSWRSVARGAAWLLLGAVGLEVLYVVAANALLHTSLIPNAVNAVQGMKLEYAGARSWWPGRVHVRGFRHRVETYDVEFELTIDDADLVIQLWPLASRQLNVEKLKAEGVRVRVRHKVHSVGRDGERLSAYPPIVGLSDPPLYRGERPPPTPDSEYHSWQVGVRNVVARVRELWVQEYRFRGDAEARGSFVLQPERWLTLEPAVLRLFSGRIELGSRLAAEQAKGELHCSIPYMDFRKFEGLEVFRAMSAKVDMTWQKGDLSFLNVYTKPSFGLTLAGSSDLAFHMAADKGVVPVNSHMVLISPDLKATKDELGVTGQFRGEFKRPSDKPELLSQLEFAQASVRHTKAKSEGPQVSQFKASAVIGGVDLTQPLQLLGAGLQGKARLPDFGWFAEAAGSAKASHAVDGRGSMSFSFERDATGVGTGESMLWIEQATIRTPKSVAKTRGSLNARFKTQTEPQASAQGAVTVQLAQVNAEDLVPGIGGVAAGVLSAQDLNANLAFHAAGTGVLMELTQATCGALKARGFFNVAAARPFTGAVLVSAGPVNVGVRVKDGGVETSPLVGADWLKGAWDAHAGALAEQR